MNLTSILSVTKQPDTPYDYNVAYCCAYDDDALTSINISNASSMVQLDSLTNTNLVKPVGVAVDTTNEVAYVITTGLDKIVAINISNSSSMVELSSLVIDNNSTAPDHIALDVANEVAYVSSSTDTAIYAIDVSNTSSMSVSGELVDSSKFSDIRGLGIDTETGTVFVLSRANADNGYFTAIDISTPSTMSITDYIYGASVKDGGGLAIDITNSKAYITDEDDHTFSSINIADHNDIIVLNELTLGMSGANAIALDIPNNMTYIASSIFDNEITAVNISNPSSLSEEDRYAHADFDDVQGLAMDSTNEILYAVSNDLSKIISIDTSTTSTLVILHSYYHSDLSAATAIALG